MTKTPEELAEEYGATVERVPIMFYKPEQPCKNAYLAGYQAARDQLADANKVVTADYVETASNDAKELITKFELQGDQDMLIKALVAAYCTGVDAVDGYLRNSLSAYRNSVKRLQWISVKERLPEIGEHGYSEDVLLLSELRRMEVSNIQKVKRVVKWRGIEPVIETENGTPIEDFTHWMPLPETPKEEK